VQSLRFEWNPVFIILFSGHLELLSRLPENGSMYNEIGVRFVIAPYSMQATKQALSVRPIIATTKVMLPLAENQLAWW
jgi:hypothetical protein